MAYGLTPLDVEEKPKKPQPRVEAPQEVREISEEEQPGPDTELLRSGRKRRPRP